MQNNRIIGRTSWAIAEGYLPAGREPQDPALKSHETLCLLNTGDEAAQVEMMVYYSDREPAGPYRVEVPARRTKHVRLDHLRDPEPIPAATDYAVRLEADRPIVVQHTRLDSRNDSLAILSTIAFSSEP